MPSDLAKKKAAKKKEAAKARQRPRKGHEENGDAVTEPQVAEEKTEEVNGRETKVFGFYRRSLWGKDSPGPGLESLWLGAGYDR